jgi:hypothetical protein
MQIQHGSQVQPTLVRWDASEIPSANSRRRQPGKSRDTRFGVARFVEPGNDSLGIDANRCEYLLQRSLGQANVSTSSYAERTNCLG